MSRLPPGSEAKDSRNGLLFLGGSGRSGSTLLEQLLAERVGGLAVGEARFFFGYYDRGDIPCGCGVSLPQCELWGPIGKRLRERFDFARIEAERSRHARMRSLLSPGAMRRLKRTDTELSRAYGELYALIAEYAGARIVIDSSKIPTHLVTLQSTFPDRLACLHLVRDPRAVAWAFSRRVKRDPASPQRGGLMLRRSTPAAVIVWALENAWTLRISKTLRRRTVIRYEDLVRSPEGVIEDAVSGFGLPHRAPREPMLHSVGGNPVRFQRGPRVIQEDREWATAGSTLFHLLVGLAVYPLLRSFGYSLWVEDGR